MNQKRPLCLPQKLLKFTKKEKRNTTKQIFILLPLLVMVMALLTSIGSRPVAEVQSKSDQHIRGVLVGDVMLAGHVQTVRNSSYKESPFKHVLPYFEQAQYVTGNFARPVVDSSQSSHFTSEAETIQEIQDVGFSVMNLANGHLMDFEESGLHETLQVFSEHDIGITGAGTSSQDLDNNISYKVIDGTTIATLGFSDIHEEQASADETSGGVMTFSPEVFIPMVIEAQHQADVVIVHAHWGQDFDNEPSERQQSLAYSLSEAGADIVVGHGPHVLQQIEIYNETAIFYSLGNFISDLGWTRARESALAQFELNENGDIHFEVVPLTIKEASPAPLTWSDKLNEVSITRQLTKHSEFDWSVEDGAIHFSTNIY